MSSKVHRLFEQSRAWIAHHPNATNLDVPDELLTQWIFNDDEEDPKPSGYFLSVFSFGFLQRRLLTDGLPASQRRTVPMALLIQNFSRWQLKLGIVELHRTTELAFAPMPLFSFPDGEEIQCWPRTGESKESLPSSG